MQPLPRTGGKASAERNQSEDLPWKNRIYVSLKNTRRMNTADICIIKRDGKREDFSASKISNAIGKAFQATGLERQEALIDEITQRVISHFEHLTLNVEEIQDLVENELMKVQPEVAKKYIIYRQWRNTERERKTQMKHIMDGIVAIDKNDVNLSNANMSSHTPAGQMMTFASEVTKDYTYKYLLPKPYAEAHRMGDIHIHDLDYYPTKTTTCIQYDLDDLFERGFHTKNGSIRTPQSIQSYATLATIIFQTNQNEQHGGQAIPAFDFFMAKGVLKSYQKAIVTDIAFYVKMKGTPIDEKALTEHVRKHLTSIEPDTKSPKGFPYSTGKRRLLPHRRRIGAHPALRPQASAERHASGYGRIYPQPEHHALARREPSGFQFHQLRDGHFSRRTDGHRRTAPSHC